MHLITRRICTAALALLLGAGAAFAQATPEAGMDPRFPFPTDPERDLPERATIPQRYYKSVGKPFNDDALALEVLIRKDWQAVKVEEKREEAARRPVCLRLWRTAAEAKVQAEIEIQLVSLARELTAENWLERYIEVNKYTVITGRSKIGQAGAAPDWLVRAQVEGASYVFRLSAFKDGDRLFLLAGRVAESDYAAVAEAFAVAVFTFRPVAPTGKRYAEELGEYRLPPPARGILRYPASWVLVEPGDKPAAGVAGAMLKWGAEKELLGLLTVKVFKKTAYPDATAESVMRVLREDVAQDAKVALQEAELRQPLSSKKFTGAGLVEIAQGARAGGRAVEWRGVVLENETSFFSFSLIGPARSVNADVWMINRRALEVVLLEVQPE